MQDGKRYFTGRIIKGYRSANADNRILGAGGFPSESANALQIGEILSKINGLYVRRGEDG